MRRRSFLLLGMMSALCHQALFGAFARATDASQPDVPGDATLTWQAASEEKTYGYLVYRGSRREGPYRRISKEIVHVPTDARTEHVYTFVDTGVIRGRTYYYYLETVSVAGVKESFSAVVAKTVEDGPR